jgi:hypothetical protein
VLDGGKFESATASGQQTPSRDFPELDVEYQYIVHVRVWETFLNIMWSEGIAIPEGSHHVSFTCGKRLNMKAHKHNGLIWSYSVIRVTKNEDVIEEG